MKTTQGAAHYYIMSTTQQLHPRIEPKTLGMICSYFNTRPLRRIKLQICKTELILFFPKFTNYIEYVTSIHKFFNWGYPLPYNWPIRIVLGRYLSKIFRILDVVRVPTGFSITERINSDWYQTPCKKPHL